MHKVLTAELWSSVYLQIYRRHIRGSSVYMCALPQVFNDICGHIQSLYVWGSTLFIMLCDIVTRPDVNLRWAGVEKRITEPPFRDLTLNQKKKEHLKVHHEHRHAVKDSSESQGSDGTTEIRNLILLLRLKSQQECSRERGGYLTLSVRMSPPPSQTQMTPVIVIHKSQLSPTP